MNCRPIPQTSTSSLLLLSPDGERLAFVRRENKTWSAVVDGIEHRGFDRVFNPVFSPNSKHVAYWARRDKTKVMVLDGEKIGHGEFLATHNREAFNRGLEPVFGPDSRVLGYILKDGKDSILVIGEERQTLSSTQLFSWSFSSEGDHMAYAQNRDQDDQASAPAGPVAMIQGRWLSILLLEAAIANGCLPANASEKEKTERLSWGTEVLSEPCLWTRIPRYNRFPYSSPRP